MLVDDSPVALTILRKMLESSPEIEVVGTARNGQEALELIPSLQPKVICTDYHMPVMDGMEFTKQVMDKFPRPILVVTSTISRRDSHKAFPLLEAGALDVFPKPRAVLFTDREATKDLVHRIKILSGVVVFRKRIQPRGETPPVTSAPATRKEGAVVPRIIAMGASTGGPPVLQEILASLPADFPVPILCVQHISPGFLEGLVEWLDRHCQLKVVAARLEEVPHPGTVYFAADHSHLKVDERGRMTVSHDPPLDDHRPSVTALFNSVAAYYGSKAWAILLTGMGSDGAQGMHAIAQAGGSTIAQDEASCAVFGMPKQAIDLGAARYVLPPEEIARKLRELVH